MKKLFKRSTLLIMALVIMLVMSTTSLATEGDEFDIQNNVLMRDLEDLDSGSYKMQNNVLVKYNGNAENVVIPNNVTAIDDSAFAENTSIKTVIIPESVTHIEAMAFRGCVNLTEVKILGSVQHMGYGVFNNCDSLKVIDLPDGLTSIPDSAFFSCNSLQSVTIPDSVKYIGSEAFIECASLTSVVIPGSVEVIGGRAFSMCSSLNSVTISEGVTTIKGGAFSNCISLTQVKIPSSVTEIEKNAFGTSSYGNVSNFTIMCDKGSAAEAYAINNSLNFITTGETIGEQPVNNEFRGFSESKNVVRTQKENIVFGGYIGKPYENGEYEVEIWDENTIIEYKYGNKDIGNIVSKGFLVKIDGKLEFAERWQGSPFKETFETISEPTEVLSVGTFKASEEFNVIVNENTYTQNSPEVYGYILYDFVPTGLERDYDDFYKYHTLKLIKYETGSDKTESNNTPTVPTTVTAIPTNSKVLVNDLEKTFDAYTINGNNYFKLRDLATVVGGTEKQFEVEWDNVKKAINLISDKAYTPVGGEMTKGTGADKTGTLSPSKIYKDGVEIQLTAYTIEGNNYFKLRDIAEAFDIGVTWDNTTKTVGIDTSIGYIAE